MPPKKELLIICDAFPPDFAPRMGYLCKNLNSRKDWNVTIISERTDEEHFNIPIGNNTIIKSYKFIKCHNTTLAKIEWLIKFILTIIFDYKTLWLNKQIDKYTENKKIDIVLCSTYSTFPLTSALTLSKKKHIPLIADLRDIAEQCDMRASKLHQIPRIGKFKNIIYKWIEKIQIKRRNNVIRKANAITTISTWHRDFLKKINSNTQLIYNGYDSESFRNKQVKSTCFDIVYTGRIVDLKHRSPELLFVAIKKLIKDYDCNKIRIKWYTDKRSKQLIKPLIEKYNINKENELNDIVKATEISDILNEASIVLVLTNKTGKNGPHGVMTTKFFEALGCERPVLCVKSDEECLAQAIKETNAGIAAKNTEEVISFILEKYKEWETKGYTKQEVKNKEIYSRQYQTKQFISLFDSLIKE